MAWFSHHSLPQGQDFKALILPKLSPNSPPCGKLRPVNSYNGSCSAPHILSQLFFHCLAHPLQKRLPFIQLLISWHFTFIKSIPHNNPKRGIFIPSLPTPFIFYRYGQRKSELNHSYTPNKDRDQNLNLCVNPHLMLFPLCSTLKHLKCSILIHLGICPQQDLSAASS